MTLAPPPRPRRIGAVNWIGLGTLCLKEIRRFVKVFSQTILAPVVTTLLFLAVFVVALGGGARMMGPVPFAEFLAPGLVMMAIVQNAFANTSSSIIISKVQGNIVDVLMPPLSPGELTLGFALGGIARGLVVGIVVALAMALFVPIHVQHWGFVVYHAVAASTLLSLLGMIGGIWADKFDHIAAVTNFIVTPLSFLSGTFYSIERLPALWQALARANPFFYMIDGFRYGFIGHADGSLLAGVLVLLGTNLVLWCVCLLMFARGYKLKA
ncbi:MAG TPA: ABC transporter permease [Alphaproteobacteria bacterium]|nr:ABC transporter permease [Alphaproteobacteria bacterium]